MGEAEMICKAVTQMDWPLSSILASIWSCCLLSRDVCENTLVAQQID